ncbi:MAG: hypothetical protein WC736_14870 [Gallionella sp.]
MAGVKGRSGGARPNCGGAQAGAGRPPKDPPEGVLGDLPSDSPLEFLLSVMRSTSADDRLRVTAATTAAQYMHVKLSDGGKKDAKADKAKEVQGGKFAQAAGPRLVRDNSKGV